MNYGRNTLEFALLAKQTAYNIKAQELSASLDLVLNKINIFSSITSSEKAKSVQDRFKSVDNVFDKYIEAITFTSNKKETKEEVKPIVNIKSLFEQQVVAASNKEEKFTVLDLINSIESLKSSTQKLHTDVSNESV